MGTPFEPLRRFEESRNDFRILKGQAIRAPRLGEGDKYSV